MSLCTTCSQPQRRPMLSNATTTVIAVITAMTFAASGAAPTPLYHQYQESFGLTPFTITIIFAAYVLSLLAALLTVGSLSDYVGRRPAILAALALNVVSMVMFMAADSAATLIAARALQGFATGLATATLDHRILGAGRLLFFADAALVRIATGVTVPVVGGLVVSALTLSGVLSVLSLRSVSPDRMLSGGIIALPIGVAVTLTGVHAQLVWLMLLGTVVAGTGFGAAFFGTMRTVLPLAKTDERAGLLSAFYVEGYLSFSLPAVVTGFVVPMVGLTFAAYVYGSAVIVMALVSMVAVRLSRT